MEQVERDGWRGVHAAAAHPPTHPPIRPPTHPHTHLPPIAPAARAQVRPPRVQESAVHMECALRHTYEIKDAQV